jgi:hypothetical protein
MSLAEARIEARQARVPVDKQRDPIALRRAVQAVQRQRPAAQGLKRCKGHSNVDASVQGLLPALRALRLPAASP